MSATTSVPTWESKKTDETRMIEDLLRQHFERVDCYRYNSASIRLRVIDSSFEGLSRDERDAKVERHIETLPEDTQRDIITLIAIAPSDLQKSPASFRQFMTNVEFDDPSPSNL